MSYMAGLNVYDQVNFENGALQKKKKKNSHWPLRASVKMTKSYMKHNMFIYISQ